MNAELKDRGRKPRQGNPASVFQFIVQRSYFILPRINCAACSTAGVTMSSPADLALALNWLEAAGVSAPGAWSLTSSVSSSFALTLAVAEPPPDPSPMPPSPAAAEP